MCYSLWYNAPTMLLASHQPATSWVHYTTSCNTQSSAPEDGQNNYPKHVELTGIIKRNPKKTAENTRTQERIHFERKNTASRQMCMCVYVFGDRHRKTVKGREGEFAEREDTNMFTSLRNCVILQRQTELQI